AGILDLAERGRASWVIGVIAASMLGEQDVRGLLRLALERIFTAKDESHSFKNLIGGAVRVFVDDGNKQEALLTDGAEGLSELDKVRLFVLAPYGRRTWRLVDALGETARAKYWSEVAPDWIHNSDAENSESVERLLRAKRPRAAFACIKLEPAKLDARI